MTLYCVVYVVYIFILHYKLTHYLEYVPMVPPCSKWIISIIKPGAKTSGPYSILVKLKALFTAVGKQTNLKGLVMQTKYLNQSRKVKGQIESREERK